MREEPWKEGRGLVQEQQVLQLLQVTSRDKKAEVVVRRGGEDEWLFPPSMKPEAKSSAKKRRGRCGRMDERSEDVKQFYCNWKNYSNHIQ